MKKILIADAADPWRELVKAALSPENQIFDCADGTQAVEIMERIQPDLLVLDLMIPGNDVLGILKGLPGLHTRPRVIVTGRYFSSYVNAALERYQVDLILMKPCEAQNLADRVAELLRADETEAVVRQGPYDPITAMLVELGVRTSQQGFRFLRTGIGLLMEEPNQMLTKQLYPAIAAMHNTSAGNVEKSIRTAIRSAWSRRRNDVWRRCFSSAANGEVPRPTSGQFLFQLAAALSASRNRRA